MIDYELVSRDLEERRALARRMASSRRLAAAAREGRRPWPASVRSAVGLGVVRIGHRLAGEVGR